MQNIIISSLIGFFASVIVAPFIIKLFFKLKNGQPILHYVESHYIKSGTPTMGGVIFMIGTIATFIFALGSNIRLATIVLLSMLSYGLIGFLDDFIKVRFKKNDGLKAYQKALGQLGIAILISIFVYNSSFVGGEILIPFTDKYVSIGIFIIPVVIFIFLAITNAVNLIDGLDGLSGSVSFIYLIGFIITLQLRITSLSNAGESLIMMNELNNVLLLSAGFAGAILAYLCFNSYPAKIFMGDTGSLAIGGFIAASATLTKMYLYIPFLGVMFVLTALSVVIQVFYFKLTKKRVFLMAPLHHHYEKKGVHETKIVAIYIVITIVTILITLLFVK